MILVPKPVVVFDSGVGGLSVLQSLWREIPGQCWHYLADTAHVPYGDKPSELVIERTVQAARHAVSADAKALVIACNTATAAAAAVVRERFPSLPVIGIEPAVKPAAFSTKTGVVGILATSNTLSSDKFKALVERFSGQARVLVQPCPGLVERIEAGDTDSDALNQLLKNYVGHLLAQGADVLVLGCTHYPFVSAAITRLAGPDVVVLETGQAVARETRRRLEALGETDADGEATVRLFASANPDRLLQAARNLVPDLPVKSASLWLDEPPTA